MRGITKSLTGISLLIGLTNFALPAQAMEVCGPLQIVTSLPITMLQSGRPAVGVKIGDTSETLLVDTGGVFSDLTKRTVRELGLKPTQSNIQVKNVRGQASNQAVRLPSITFGGLRQEGAYFQVAAGEDNPNDTRPQAFAGTLGPDLLRNFDADFDFGANKLNLVSSKHCDGKVVYWQAPAVAIVPVHIARFGHILFPMMLDGKKLNVLLDTGASNTTMNLDVAMRDFKVDVGDPDVEKVGEISGGYTANVYRRRFKTLEIDGVAISDPTITLLPNLMGGPKAPPIGSLIRNSDDAEGLPDLILGMNVMSKLHVYIAYKESKLYLSAAAAPNQLASLQKENVPPKNEPASLAAGASANSTTAPVLQAVNIRTDVTRPNGNKFDVVPDFHFTAPNGNATALRRELIATDGPFTQANFRDTQIRIPPEAQKRGAVQSGGWQCGKAQYYVTIRASIMDADGNRSNSMDYTIHCNGG